MTTEPAVRLDRVSKRFGRTDALRDVSLEAKDGEFLVLLGPSGSGKTTLLRIIAGFEGPTAGEVWIRGRLVGGLPAYRRDLGIVFQNLALFPHMTVRENVRFGLQMRNVPRREADGRVAEALRMVHLDGLEARMPSQLSGGQQQRVALARAIVIEPAVLLLDEPLGSLDRHLRTEMQVEIRRLQQALRITTLMVTHDQEEAMTMADAIAVLHDGTLAQMGSVFEVYERPTSAFVAAFMGAANILDLTLTEPDGAHLRGWHDTGMVFRVGTGAVNSLPCRRKVMLRPEHLRVSSEPGLHENCVPATVAAVQYVGANTRFRLMMAGSLEVTALVHSADWGAERSRAIAGHQVYASWPASAMVVLPGDEAR